MASSPFATSPYLCFGQPVEHVPNAFRTSALFRAPFDSATLLLSVNDVSATGALTGVEPLPNSRDDILVERLVKTMRYVADMRRCQYVVQRPQGVRRRQRLNVEYVDRRA